MSAPRRKVLVILCQSIILVAVCTFACADYLPLYMSLADGRYDDFKRHALKELGRESSLARKRTILEVLSVYSKKFYNLSDFSGKFLPFNTEQCLQRLDRLNLCSSEQGFKFLLRQEQGLQERHQTFSVQNHDQLVFNYSAHSRTLLLAADISFGRGIHLIIPKKKTKEFFLLIREIEKVQGQISPVHQTIHVIRLRHSSVCKILESDMSEDDTKYPLIEEFVRVFGDQVSCQKTPITI